MSIDIFSIGLTGLNAAKIGLDTTGNNISNVNTPGYSRQQIVQSPAIGQGTNSGYEGHGTQVDNIARQYNQFLQKQTLSNQSQSSYYDGYAAQLSQLNNLIGDSTTGVSPALQEFFTATQQVADNPSSASSRQTMIGSAQALVSQFKGLDGQLQTIQDSVNQNITQTVSDINGLGKRIADLNQKIVSVSANSNQQPNDLLDQRDAAMMDLNKLIQASGSVKADGSMDVFIGNGQGLVVSNQAQTLITVPNAANPTQRDVALQTNSTPVVLDSSTLPGGQLAGLLDFRDQSLNLARNGIGKLAVGFATTFNNQQQLGLDFNGALGANLFSVGQPTVLPNTKNTGNAVVGAAITNIGQLTTSDYSLSISGGQYTMTRLSDKTSQTSAGFPITMDGITVSGVSGNTVNGDQFLIQPTHFQANSLALNTTDGNKIAAASPIQTQQASTNKGSGVISSGNVVNNAASLPLSGSITLSYNAVNSTFTVTGGATPATFPYTSGSTVTLNGNLQFNISGTPKAGDQFTIAANTAGSGDNRNALNLAQLQSARTMDQGTSTYQSVYSQMVSTVGSQSRAVTASSKSQASLLQSSIAASQSISGVNLDEEAARLLQYQQAYQAAGKLLQIASTLFDTVLSIGR